MTSDTPALTYFHGSADPSPFFSTSFLNCRHQYQTHYSNSGHSSAKCRGNEAPPVSLLMHPRITAGPLATVSIWELMFSWIPATTFQGHFFSERLPDPIRIVIIVCSPGNNFIPGYAEIPTVCLFSPYQAHNTAVACSLHYLPFSPSSHHLQTLSDHWPTYYKKQRGKKWPPVRPPGNMLINENISLTPAFCKQAFTSSPTESTMHILHCFK